MRLNQDPLKKIEESIEEIERSVATRWRSALTSVTQYDEAVNVERVVKHLHDALAVMRTELECAREELGKAESRNQSLAKSQAEALVNSAEIIIELEETKRCLMESHEAEREAKIAAERLVGFGNILDASDNEIYLFDCHTLRFVHVNQGARKNIGYSMDELREMTPLHVKPEFDRDTFERTLEPLRSGRCNAVRFTTVHLRKDGTRYPVEVHLHRSEFEERVVFVAVILDSTQKEQAEDEIRKLSITVEQSPASVVIMDVNGGIEYVNPMFTQVKGISRREALASDSRKMLEDRLFGNQYDEIWQTVCAGKIWCGEVENRQNNGEPSWESVSISPIRNSREEITHFLVTFQDVTDKKKLLEQMEYMAFHDSLTGLPNRASVLRHIQKAFDERNAERSALLFLDFDRFKLINDSLGHKIGDELLRQISDRLRSNLGHLDTVVSARLGGDEFVVFLSDPPSSDFVANVADKLLQAFAESYQLFGNTVHSTVSIGIVTSQHGYQSANEMLRDADLAMYEAKAKGKGCSVVFNESMYERAEKRLKIECELRKAILRDEFVLHYQPIIALESGRLAGVETLVRWNHPERGLVYPDSFIPIAEETRLILAIGERILHQACHQFSQWQRSLGVLAPCCIHVNVSRLQMLLPCFVERVDECLREYNVPPHCLHLEVTESVIMQDTRMIVDAMNALREIGVKIDMDDFGTGYSSLSCLHEFPIDIMKIDRSFINSARDVQEYVALLHAILTLANNLRLEVVAEGVETPSQLAALQAMGCEYGQGYLFSKPLPAAQLEAYARRIVHQTGTGNGESMPNMIAGIPNQVASLVTPTGHSL